MTDPMSSPVPTSAIDVHTSFFPLAFMLLLFKPKVAINGVVYDQGSWGDIRIPVPAGRYQVEAWLPYLFFPTMGRNGATVDVPPGAVVQVRWRAPWLVFLQGKVKVTGPFALDPASAPASAPPPPAAQLAPPPVVAQMAPPPPSTAQFAPPPPVTQVAPPPPPTQPPSPPTAGSAF